VSKHQMHQRWQVGLRFVLLSALCVPLAAGCRSTEQADGTARAVELVPVPVNSFTAQWRAELPARESPLSRLALLNDQLFAFTADNRVFWLNRDSGIVLGLERLASPRDTVFNPVAISDRIVFPSTKQLLVYDLRARLLGRINTRYNVSSPAAADSGLLFYGVDHAHGGRLVAREITPQPYDIGPKWELMTRGHVSAAPAAYQGQIFSGSRDGNVYAVRAEDRVALWPGLEGAAFKTGGPILANIVADKDGVLVASTDSKLYCLDPTTGLVRWTYYAGVALREHSAPVATANHVYIYVPGTGLVAIDKAGRQEIRQPKWIVADARQFLSHDERNAYLRTADNHIVAVDKETGRPLFRSDSNDFSLFVSNTVGATIYAASPSGDLLAIVPVLKPGTVGQIVLHHRGEPLALGQ
jgi:outer membrane protein assembly factor BamB